MFLCMIGDLLYFMVIYIHNSLIKNYLWTVVVHCEVGRAPGYSSPLAVVSFALGKIFKWRGIVSHGGEVKEVFNTVDAI